MAAPLVPYHPDSDPSRLSAPAPARREGADEPDRLPGPCENLSLGRDGRPRLAGGVADDRHRRVCGRHGGLGFRQIHLMNILGCLDVPTAGTYILDGTDVSTMGENRLAEIPNSKSSFVFQNSNL